MFFLLSGVGSRDSKFSFRRLSPAGLLLAVGYARFILPGWPEAYRPRQTAITRVAPMSSQEVEHCSVFFFCHFWYLLVVGYLFSKIDNSAFFTRESLVEMVVKK